MAIVYSPMTLRSRLKVVSVVFVFLYFLRCFWWQVLWGWQHVILIIFSLHCFQVRMPSVRIESYFGVPVLKRKEEEEEKNKNETYLAKNKGRKEMHLSGAVRRSSIILIGLVSWVCFMLYIRNNSMCIPENVITS